MNFNKSLTFIYMIIGFDHRRINSKYHPKEFFKKMWNTLGNGQIFRGEIRNVAKDGTIVWVDATIFPFVNDKGRPYKYMSICKNITDKKKAEEELVFLAYHDELTGLANKRKMKDMVTKEINGDQPFTLIGSSLSYLRDFPINRLKIDQSFGQDIQKSGDSSIVRTIIAMAKSLGFHVTAEGVEIQRKSFL